MNATWRYTCPKFVYCTVSGQQVGAGHQCLSATRFSFTLIDNFVYNLINLSLLLWYQWCLQQPWFQPWEMVYTGPRFWRCHHHCSLQLDPRSPKGKTHRIWYLLTMAHDIKTFKFMLNSYIYAALSRVYLQYSLQFQHECSILEIVSLGFLYGDGVR